MSIEMKQGNVFDSTTEYLCHQVNCMGKMGSGIAKTVREKYPLAYSAYMTMCSNSEPEDILGATQLICCADRTIVNIFAQKNYGYDGKRYTDYEAFRSCLRYIANTILPGSTISFPYGIGCGLGGGDWDIVQSMISEELSENFRVEIWKM